MIDTTHEPAINLQSLLNKQFEAPQAPVFVPKYPEVRTIVKRTVMPGSGDFMPKGSLRQSTIIEDLDEIDELIAEVEGE